jgi:TPR repeat protein
MKPRLALRFAGAMRAIAHVLVLVLGAAGAVLLFAHPAPADDAADCSYDNWSKTAPERSIAACGRRAARGDAIAMVNLGQLYRQAGHYGEAMIWSRRAADRGNAVAQCDVGYLYRKGYGVAENDVVAAFWYRLAAEQGDLNCQYNIAGMYHSGTGVTQNDVEAYKWISLAAAQGDRESAQKRDALAKTMTAS